MNSLVLSVFMISAIAAAESMDTIEYTQDGRAFDLGVYIDEGSPIEVTGYDSRAELYGIKNLDYPKTSWFRASREDLAKAVPSLDANELKQSPSSVIGELFTTESDLRLTPPENSRVPASVVQFRAK